MQANNTAPSWLLTVTTGDNTSRDTTLPYSDDHVEIKLDGLTIVIEVKAEQSDIAVQSIPPELNLQGTGNDSISSERGRAIIEAMSGSNTISNSSTSDPVFGNAQSIVAEGEKKPQHLIEAHSAPLPDSDAATFIIRGDEQPAAFWEITSNRPSDSTAVARSASMATPRRHPQTPTPPPSMKTPYASNWGCHHA